ncbi:MAG: sodium:proton antiporter [Chryseosolibacter sp.]
MNQYILILTIIGAAALGMAWMPAVTRKIKVSYSVLYVFMGFLLYTFLDSLPEPNPSKETNITLRLTELVVIVSLMGTGLKIDEPFSFKGWRVPMRLVSVTMLVSILATSLLGYYWLGFSVSSAILLGAALAPTDPVLASDVQVGPPLERTRNNVRFSLTAEAGLNDGMAFPFTWLAIAFVLHPADQDTVGMWILEDLLLRLALGVAVGLLTGRGLAYLIFQLPRKSKIESPADGFVALSVTLLVYGLTELLHGYGFMAVFVCAVTMRNFEAEHKYHRKLHSFMDQIERILVAMVLILFGGSIANGILSIIDWKVVLFGVVSLLIIRPLSAYLSVMNMPFQMKEKLMISFYGIKGVGSLFYLAFALHEAPFAYGAELWCAVSFIILCSILLHGFTAPVIMAKSDDTETGEHRKKTS